MTRPLPWTLVFSMGPAAPCAAGPALDAAAATKAWTERFSSHDLEGLLALDDRKGVPTSSATVARRWLIVDHHSTSVPAAPRQ